MSEIIATLLLIAIALAAALLVYAFATGLFGNLAGGGPSSLVTATGGIIVPGSTSTSGVLTLNLRNEGTQSISNVIVSCGTPPFASATCNGISLNYAGMAVSTTNLLPPNAFASGSLVVDATSTFTAGTTYVLTVTVDYVGGSIQTVVVNVHSAA